MVEVREQFGHFIRAYSPDQSNCRLARFLSLPRLFQFLNYLAMSQLLREARQSR